MVGGGLAALKELYNVVNDFKISFVGVGENRHTDLTRQSTSGSQQDAAGFHMALTAFGAVTGGVNALIKFPSAESQALSYAEDVMKSTPKSKMPRSVTSIVDKETGQVYNGQSGGLKGQEINPELKKLFPTESLEKWTLENYSECDALNKALNAGASPKNLEMHTLKIEKSTGTTANFPRCSNCEVTTQQIKTTSDK